MFDKIVVVDDAGLREDAQGKLAAFGKQVLLFGGAPNEKEVIERIGDADCVVVSFATKISRAVMDACPGIRYIGMSCSLYGPESCNVDLIAAEEKGIEVTGIFHYGDNGVREFVVSELVQLLHGFHGRQWREVPVELTGRKIGIVGCGTVGQMVGEALQYFGADIYYTDIVPVVAADVAGFTHMNLKSLLETVDIVSTHLPRNSCLLGEKEFAVFGDGKILVNTSLGPVFSVPALKKWLQNENNYYICCKDGMGDCAEELGAFRNVIMGRYGAGYSAELIERRSAKVLANMATFLTKENTAKS